jgi:hypothetical protein
MTLQWIVQRSATFFSQPDLKRPLLAERALRGVLRAVFAGGFGESTARCTGPRLRVIPEADLPVGATQTTLQANGDALDAASGVGHR